MKKKCSKCKEIKEESEFYFNKIHNCYFAECKICNRKRSLEYAKKNNYKCQKKWIKENSEKMIKYQKKWIKNNYKNYYLKLKERNKNLRQKMKSQNPKLYKLIKQFDYLKGKFKKLTGIKMTFERQRLSIELLTQRIEKIKGLIKYYQEVYFLKQG